METLKNIISTIISYPKNAGLWVYENLKKLFSGEFSVNTVASIGVPLAIILVAVWYFAPSYQYLNIFPTEVKDRITTSVERAKAKISGHSEERLKIYIDWPKIKNHYYSYHDTALPKGDVITICSGYSCQLQTAIRLNDEAKAELKSIMSSSVNAESEREALKKAVAFFEAYVGEIVGTKKDRPGIDFFGSGDVTQLDAVDESTNVTSLLLWLAENGLLGYHSIYSPYWQTGFMRNRYAALVYDRKHKTSWVIDSNLGVNGEEPLIMELEKWRVR